MIRAFIRFVHRGISNCLSVSVNPLKASENREEGTIYIRYIFPGRYALPIIFPLWVFRRFTHERCAIRSPLSWSDNDAADCVSIGRFSRLRPDRKRIRRESKGSSGWQRG